MESQGQMFTPQAIGFVDSPYKETAAIPKGLGAKHDAEGVFRILPEFELGLTDIEGFSHLMVIWARPAVTQLTRQADGQSANTRSLNRPKKHPGFLMELSGLSRSTIFA